MNSVSGIVDLLLEEDSFEIQKKIVDRLDDSFFTESAVEEILDSIGEEEICEYILANRFKARRVSNKFLSTVIGSFGECNITWEIAKNHFTLGILNEDELIELIDTLGDDSELLMLLIKNNFRTKPISQKLLFEIANYYSGTKLAHYIMANHL